MNVNYICDIFGESILKDETKHESWYIKKSIEAYLLNYHNNLRLINNIIILISRIHVYNNDDNFTDAKEYIYYLII